MLDIHSRDFGLQPTNHLFAAVDALYQSFQFIQDSLLSNGIVLGLLERFESRHGV